RRELLRDRPSSRYRGLCRRRALRYGPHLDQGAVRLKHATRLFSETRTRLRPPGAPRPSSTTSQSLLLCIVRQTFSLSWVLDPSRLRQTEVCWTAPHLLRTSSEMF